MIHFWIDALTKLAPFWDPSWGPRAVQNGPKTPPRRSQRRHQESSRATRAPKIKIESIFRPTQGGYPIGRSDGVPISGLNFHCPTCLLKHTFQKVIILKKDEHFSKEHIQHLHLFSCVLLRIRSVYIYIYTYT